MDKEKLINKVCNELVHGKNIDFTFEINGIPYSIKFLSPIMIYILVYQV